MIVWVFLGLVSQFVAAADDDCIDDEVWRDEHGVSCASYDASDCGLYDGDHGPAADSCCVCKVSDELTDEFKTIVDKYCNTNNATEVALAVSKMAQYETKYDEAMEQIGKNLYNFQGERNQWLLTINAMNLEYQELDQKFSDLEDTLGKCETSRDKSNAEYGILENLKKATDEQVKVLSILNTTLDEEMAKVEELKEAARQREADNGDLKKELAEVKGTQVDTWGLIEELKMTASQWESEIGDLKKELAEVMRELAITKNSAAAAVSPSTTMVIVCMMFSSLASAAITSNIVISV